MTKYTCRECGSDVVAHQEVVGGMGGSPDQVMGFTDYCTNTECRNTDPAIHTLGWAVEVQ